MTHASRRSLMAAMGAAVVGGIHVPATDPIYAAIETYKQASHAYCESWADWEGDLDAWRAENTAIDEAYHAAFHALESTTPTTTAGAAAVLAFLLEDDPEWACSWHEGLVRNVTETLQRLS